MWLFRFSGLRDQLASERWVGLQTGSRAWTRAKERQNIGCEAEQEHRLCRENENEGD